ncbi:MAG: serine/threonine-protein kinase RsbW [Actinomycetota bacterium]|nr:serine/threonine-protein kinase RsbW [Actinomycetota bacterium]
MDTISVSIPASPAYIQVVRLIASGLATRLKFTIDEIEDLKIAVDELCAYLTGSQGREGTLELNFNLAEDSLEITGAGKFAPGQKARTELTEFSKMILETVADSASLDQQNGTPTFSLVKSKR